RRVLSARSLHDALPISEARTRVARAREAMDIAALGPAEAALRVGVARVFALAEAYPDLKANANFMRLQHRITELENAIADRRELDRKSTRLNSSHVKIS